MSLGQGSGRFGCLIDLKTRGRIGEALSRPGLLFPGFRGKNWEPIDHGLRSPGSVSIFRGHHGQVSVYARN